MKRMTLIFAMALAGLGAFAQEAVAPQQAQQVDTWASKGAFAVAEWDYSPDAAKYGAKDTGIAVIEFSEGTKATAGFLNLADFLSVAAKHGLEPVAFLQHVTTTRIILSNKFPR